MKILIIAGYTPSLINFRGDLIRDMVLAGHEVIAAGPEAGYENQIKELGADFARIPLERAKISILNDLNFLLKIRELVKKEKPDLVFSYTIKPVVYGSLAARLAGVKNIYAMVTGLGYAFTAQTFKAKIIKTVSSCLYYLALKGCKQVFFQNPDDRQEFVKRGITKAKKCVLVNGSGVNLDKFEATELAEEHTFLMIGRVLRDKGVIEYLEAAQTVKKRYPESRFLLVGPFDSNPNSLSQADLEPYIKNGSIEYAGSTDDVRSYLAQCSVFVLPSYREGTPRTILEAMAMKRPIITTDAPGCRETVIDGENGFLVPVQDSSAIAEKMVWMIENRSETAKMAERSLEICREKYDVKKVNAFLLNQMNLEN